MWPFPAAGGGVPALTPAEAARAETTRAGGARAQAEGGASATEIAVDALQREARGAVVEPGALALAEACIGLWERALASATVEPASMAPVTAAVLALAGRMLATRGNSLFEIAVARSGVALHPAATWDPRGGYRAETRRYYLTMSGPQHTVTHNLAGDAVLHFAIGAGEAEWWRGRGPLYRSSATAALAARLEKQMTDETKIPVGRIIPLALSTVPTKDGTDASSGAVQSIREGGIAVVSTGQGAAMEQVPAARYQPQKMGAHPAETATALRTAVGQEIVAAFGVPPALIVEGADGTAQRESWRRFWTGTVAPLGALIQGELRAKLDPAAMVSFEALRASDEDGRSRAVSRRAQAFKTLIDAEVPREEAMRLAGLGDAA